MFGATLKATNSSFQKGMTFCRSIYVKKVMKLLAFIFEQPSYLRYFYCLAVKCLSVNPETCVRFPAGTGWDIFRATRMEPTVNNLPYGLSVHKNLPCLHFT